MEAHILIDNLPVDERKDSLKRALKSLPGVTGVLMMPEDKEVLLVCSGEEGLRKAKSKLIELGYPENRPDGKGINFRK